MRRAHVARVEHLRSPARLTTGMIRSRARITRSGDLRWGSIWRRRLHLRGSVTLSVFDEFVWVFGEAVDLDFGGKHMLEVTVVALEHPMGALVRGEGHLAVRYE